MMEDLIHLSLHNATDLETSLTASGMNLKRPIILAKAPWAQYLQSLFTTKKKRTKVKEPRKILLHWIH